MRNKKIIFACICALSMVSCRVAKTVNKTAELQHQKEQLAYDMLVQTQNSLKQAIATAQFELSQDGKSLKSKAEVVLIADSCIQISVRPFLGIEVFRAGVMPDGLILLDRLNGQYCRVGDSELKRYGGMSALQFFNLLQSSLSGVAIGWDLLPIRKGDIANYLISFEGNLCTILSQQPISKGFNQVLKGNRLSESNYSSDQVGVELKSTVEYSDDQDSISVPEKTIVQAKNLKGKEQVRLELYNYKIDRKPSINLQIPRSYQSKSLAEVIESIK